MYKQYFNSRHVQLYRNNVNGNINNSTIVYDVTKPLIISQTHDCPRSKSPILIGSFSQVMFVRIILHYNGTCVRVITDVR